MQKTCGRRLITVAALSVGISALAGCGPSMGRLNQVAGGGGIDQSAPVIANVQVEIAAPVGRVWALLVNAPAWPDWDEDIAKVSVREPLVLGTRFTWGEGASTVHSQVQLFEPERRLGWTGTAYTAKAVHQWELRPIDAGHTLVRVSESMDGPLMARLISSQKLAEAADAWLVQLKKAAEKR